MRTLKEERIQLYEGTRQKELQRALVHWASTYTEKFHHYILGYETPRQSAQPFQVSDLTQFVVS